MVPRGLRRVTSVTYQQAAANAEQLTLIVWPFSALLSKPSSATRYRIRQNIISSLFYCAYRGNWPSHGLIAKRACRVLLAFSLGNALPVSRPPAQENQSGSANAEHDPKWTVGLSPAACFVFGLARGSTSPPREPVGAEGARRALTGDEAGTRAPPSLRGPPSGGSARFRVPEIRIE